MNSGSVDEAEDRMRAEMFAQAQIDQDLHAIATIEPAREQINLEHNVRIDDFLPIVSNNPLVPAGREYLYARGFHAGITGDFLVAAHLLIPQIEHSIRHLLSQHGALTSGLNAQGIQEERDLNTLLHAPEMQTIWGENITFDLPGLLIERNGSNLRNRSAHGLIAHDEFFSLRMSYLWWLTLRLCCVPILAEAHKDHISLSSTDQA